MPLPDPVPVFSFCSQVLWWDRGLSTISALPIINAECLSPKPFITACSLMSPSV